MSLPRNLSARVLVRFVFSAALAVGAVAFSPAAFAQPGFWTGAGTPDPNWSNVNNWAANFPPGSGNLAIFDSGSTQNLATVNDNVGASYGGFQIGAVPGAAAVSIGGNGFTILNDGIDMTGAANTQSFTIALNANEKITLGAAQTWKMKVLNDVTQNQTLTINAPIDGAVGANLTYNPSPTNMALFRTGTIQILGANTYAGDTFVGGPNTTYVLGQTTVLDGGGAIVSGPFGKGTVTNSSFNTAPQYQVVGNIMLANPMLWGSGFGLAAASSGGFTLNGPIGFINNITGQVNRTINNIANQTITINGNITMSQTGDTLAKPLLIQSGLAGSSIVVNGLIEDGAGPATFNVGQTTIVNKTGVGTAFINSTANTYTGQSNVQNGLLEVKLLADMGTPSSLGTGTAVSEIRVGNAATAGTLRYTGSTNSSTNRQLRMIGTTGDAIIENTGTGTLSFTNAAFGAAGAGTKFLKLGGTNTGANTIAGVITDGGGANVTKLDKNGTGTWVLTGANTYSGATTVTAGTLQVSNTSGSGTGTSTVAVSSGATLGGTGTISGAITNNGIIAPGASVGTLTASGNVTMAASSHLAIELSGATSDLLAVGGNLDLSAADFLDVTGAGTGSSWVIATYVGSLTGTFDTVTSGYTVNYGAGSNSQITLNAVPAGLPGDFNSDGKVDAGDYVTWRKNDGTNNALANDNGLGTPVGPAHYTLWRANFGNPPGAGSGDGLGAGAIPEPAGAMLALLAVIFGGTWIRPKRA